MIFIWRSEVVLMDDTKDWLPSLTCFDESAILACSGAVLGDLGCGS